MWVYLIAFAVLLVIFLLTVGYSLYCFGFFERVYVSTGPSPFKFSNQRIVYKLDEGTYYSSSYTFTELVSILPDAVTFAVYVRVDEELRRRYGEEQKSGANKRIKVSAFASDDLEVTQFNPKSDNFSYAVGAVIEGMKLTREQKRLLRTKGYRYREMPSEVKHSVFVNFPYFGSLSTAAGARKAYPALVDYIQERRLCAYPVVELYNQDTIHYIVPLSEQSNFMELLDEPVGTDGYISTDDDQDGEKVEDESTEIDEDNTEADVDDVTEIDESEGSLNSFEEL